MTQEEDAVPLPTPHAPPLLIIMRPSRRKWIKVMLVCLGFLALSAARIADEGMMWFDIIGLPVFNLGVLLAATQLAPGWNELRLDAEGFATVRLGRTQRHRWQDVAGDFTACAIGRTELVMFSLASSLAQPGRTQAANLALCGQTHGLPDTYGPSAAELASLMSALRAKALHLTA